MKRKPTFSKSVINGLACLAGVVEAGGPEDILGNYIDGRRGDPETRQSWKEICAATKWIRDMQAYQDEKKAIAEKRRIQKGPLVIQS